MSTPLVLVTCTVEESRPAIEDAVSASADVEFLADVPEGRHAQAVAEADYLLSLSPARELDDKTFDRLGPDQVLQLVTAGVDHVPLDRLPDGMQVYDNAGAYAEPMAEHVVALYLALAKRLPVEHHNLTQEEFNMFQPTRRVDGSTCGIFGFGAVGEATARLLKPMGVEVHAINRQGEAEEPTASLGTPENLDAVLGRCDGLVIAAPLTSETRGRIGRAELATMADDAFLVNVSRGEIVDQGALYAHLEANPEFQAGLDAWWVEPVRHGEFALEYPFLDLPNVLGSPHNSAMVPGAMEEGLGDAVRNLRGIIDSDDHDTPVDRELGY